MNFTSASTAIPLTLAVLLLAGLIRRYTKRTTPRPRRMVILWGGYGLSFIAALVLPVFGLVEAGAVAASIATFIGWVTLANLVLLTLFELALPRAGARPPSIMADLAIAAAYLVIIIAGLRRMGVDPAGIVATSAIVTGILALSLQHTLGNIVGGIALQLDNSVKVGDWLELDGGRQGVVREIRWRHTVLETRDWDTIVVPNASLLAANILILGKRESEPVQRRMHIRFNVDFRYSPAHVIAAAQSALRTPPAIAGMATDPPPHCVCLDFANDQRSSFSLYSLRYWLTNLPCDDLTNSLVRQRLFASLRRAGIQMAMPAAQIFIEHDDADNRERKQKKQLEGRLDALRSVDFLHVLRDEELERIAEGLQPAPYTEGETITRQGEEGHWLYILAKGTAEVRIRKGSHERVVATLTAPTFFGEMSLMTGEPRGATVTALTDVSCFRLYRDEFRDILTSRPEAAKEISTTLARRKVELDSIRDDLDVKAQAQRVTAESNRLLSSIQAFFGLSDGPSSRR